MAQLDASLILGAKPIQVENPVNALAKVMQVQGMQQQNQLGQMKMDQAKAAGVRQNRLAELLRGGADEEGLRREGFIDEASQIGKDRSAATTSAAQAEKLKLQTAMERLSAVGQIMAGVKDQASYDQARAQAQAMGLDVSQSPPQYDPAMVEQKRMQALTMEQQLAQVWKQKGFDLDERKFGEVQRNNQAQNAISRGQLGVAQGNLGLRRQELAQSQNAPRGQFIQTDQGYVLADPRTGQVQPVMGADGKPVQGKTATKNLTEGQAKANLFGSRMVESDRILSDLEGKYSPMAVNAKAAMGELPLIGGIAGAIGNTALSSAGQQAEQAQRDFINAVLRRESGAVIAETEFQNAKKQYFPQPGDDKKVLEQKRRNRATAISGMAAEIPGGLRSVPTASSPGGVIPPAGGGFKILSVE
jgi:hypothetical protein